MQRNRKPHRFVAPELAEIPGSDSVSGPSEVPSIQLSPSESHHAINVLRLKEDTPVELFDGKGRSARARITAIHHRRVSVSVEEIGPVVQRCEPIVHVGFSVPRGKRVDWLLEKATELGAVSLHPVIFERSIPGNEELNHAKRQRWESHCVEAAKQCGLDFLPTIEAPMSLPEVVAHAEESVRLVGEPDGGAKTIAEVLERWESGKEIFLLIGPEGSPTGAERELILAADFVPVRLGRTTLRVETAAIALLAGAIAICGRGR